MRQKRIFQSFSSVYEDILQRTGIDESQAEVGVVVFIAARACGKRASGGEVARQGPLARRLRSDGKASEKGTSHQPAGRRKAPPAAFLGCLAVSPPARGISCA